MHKQSHAIMAYFVEKYLDLNSKIKILDVGSYDVNGTYKDLFEFYNWKYFGLDMQSGLNVDIVSKSAYEFVLPDNSFDVVISGNTLEHVHAPWLWIKEIERVVKVGGLLCLIVPFFAPVHRHPIDCWRIAPDGMRYLLTKHCDFLELEIGIDNETPCDVYGIVKKGS